MTLLSTKDDWLVDPTTYVNYGQPCTTNSRSVAATNKPSGTFTITGNDSCTATRLNTDTNSWLGSATCNDDNYPTGLTNTVSSTTPMLTSNVYVDNDIFYMTPTYWHTNLYTNVVTDQLSTEYPTSDLIANNYSYTDPTWYDFGSAVGDLAMNEACIYNLQKMRYYLVFIAPAGQTFRFQYAEVFTPFDTTVSSSILNVVTVTGTGTGQLQTWPASSPREVLPYFYSVTSGSCTFTRGGVTDVVIPGGAAGGFPPIGPGSPGLPTGPGGGGGGGGGGCGGCGCASTTAGVTAANHSVSVRINMGNGLFGSALGTSLTTGFLFIEETNTSPRLFTPATLHYMGGYTNAHVIYDVNNTNNLRQVLSPQILANITTNSATAYQFVLYPNTGSLTMSGGLYNLPGSPISSNLVQQMNSSTNQWRLTAIDCVNSTTTTYDYVWSGTANGWTLTSGGGLRSESMSWNLSTLTRTNTVQNTNGQIAYQKITTYYQYPAPLGQLAIKEVVDPAGAALTTQWFYGSVALFVGDFGDISGFRESSS